MLTMFFDVIGNYDGPFDIQRGMGAIVIARPLDAETQSLYNMTVQVSDGTNTATAQVSSVDARFLTDVTRVQTVQETFLYWIFLAAATEISKGEMAYLWIWSSLPSLI